MRNIKQIQQHAEPKTAIEFSIPVISVPIICAIFIFGIFLAFLSTWVLLQNEIDKVEISFKETTVDARKERQQLRNDINNVTIKNETELKDKIIRLENSINDLKSNNDKLKIQISDLSSTIDVLYNNSIKTKN